MVNVWAVIYSNYDPPEVASIYDNETAAEAHADDLDGPWYVQKWSVGSTYEPTRGDASTSGRADRW